MTANEISAARDGLAALLAGVPGLNVVAHPVETVSQLPTALVAFEGREAVNTLAGGATEGRFRVTLLVASASASEAYDTLHQFASSGGSASIEAAVAADPTWRGAVAHGELVSVDNIGPRAVGRSRYVGADFHFRYVASSND